MNIMRSKIGAFFRFLVAVCFFFILCRLIHVYGNICKLQKTGECTNAIVTVDKKSAEEETSFNVYIFHQGIRELAVMLIYENGYICHQTNGHTCTSLADDTFNVNLGCKPLQDVTLVGDGQQPVKCQSMEIKSDPPVESTNNNKDSNCDCRHSEERESGSSVYHSRQKRCPCPSASHENPDVNPNIGKADDNGGEVDNPKENGSLVPIIVTSLTSAILAAVVVVVLLLYRKQMVLWWKKNSNEHIDKENADTKDPLNTENI